MAEHQKKSEAELNELLTEYWKLRHETGWWLPLPVVDYLLIRSPAEVYMEILANKLKLKVSAE
jgi:kinetochore protein Nuf2